MKEINFRAMRCNLFVALIMLFQHLPSNAQLLHGIPYIKHEQIPSLKKIIHSSTSIHEKVTALTLLSAHYFHNPYPRSKNLNSALRLANEAATISKKAGLTKSYNDAQFLIAYAYLRKKHLDSAGTVLAMVNDSTRFKILLGMAHYTRAFGSGNKYSRLKKAMDITLQAQEISKKLNDTLKKIMVMREIACIESEKLQPDSEKQILNVIKLFQGIGYPYLHYTYYELVGLVFLQGNDDKALYYSDLALKSMIQTKDSAGAADLFLTHAMVLGKIGSHEKSVEYIKLAINLYKTQYGDGTITDALSLFIDESIKIKQNSEADRIVTKLFNDYPPDNRSDSLKWLSTMGNFFRLTKEFSKAEMYYIMDMGIRKKHNYRIPHHSIGQLYVESGKFAKAKYHLEKALQDMDSTTSLRSRGHLHYCLFLADSAMGNYLSAIRHLSQNKRYDDSLLTQSKVDAIQKYQAQFETTKKEDSLKYKDQHISLLKHANTLQSENLGQADLIKNVTTTGIVLVLIITALLYRQYRIKQKSNTVISQKNEQLQHLVSEKEWLLKEVHHRVKNNLQTVISLLELQSEYLSQEALAAVQASQNRIYATSLLHQMLYRDEDVSAINMSNYIPQLIQHLKDVYGVNRSIHFKMDIEPIELDVSQAIPVGLIVNEVVTNAIKYAFREKKTWDEISISFAFTNEGLVKLVIVDNGIGFLEVGHKEASGLGLQLVWGLTGDLGGKVNIESENGTFVRVQFKPRLALINMNQKVPLSMQANEENSDR